VPDAARTIGTVAALEAPVDCRHHHLIVPGTCAGATVEPGTETPNGKHPARRTAMPPASCSGASQ
jgi:hypothetical protein